MGTTTEVQLCNLALARIGQREFIDNLDDDETAVAEACRVLYGPARDAVLESVPWKFATRRATLALSTSPARDGWTYVYALPADCVSARAVTVPGIRAPAAGARIPFDTEADSSPASLGKVDSRVLLTNQAGAELVYTAQVETVALFPPLFVEAVAWKLASDLALCVLLKPAIAEAMMKKYELELSKAAASQYRQSREDQPPESEFTAVRGGSGEDMPFI